MLYADLELYTAKNNHLLHIYIYRKHPPNKELQEKCLQIDYITKNCGKLTIYYITRLGGMAHTQFKRGTRS